MMAPVYETFPTSMFIPILMPAVCLVRALPSGTEWTKAERMVASSALGSP